MLENSLTVFAAVLITHTFDEASIAIAFGPLEPMPPPVNFSATAKSFGTAASAGENGGGPVDSAYSAATLVPG